MALNIKNPETEALARKVARRCGTGITEAVTIALREKLEREQKKLRPDDIEARMRRIDAIVKRYNSRPERDTRPADEILGYNDQGHFD